MHAAHARLFIPTDIMTSHALQQSIPQIKSFNHLQCWQLIACVRMQVTKSQWNATVMLMMLSCSGLSSSSQADC